jgi:hypothetical protein
MARAPAMAIFLALLAAAPPSFGQSAVGGTAPSYPGNTIGLKQAALIVAGIPTKIQMFGHADWGGPTDETTIPYSLNIYAQNADVDPNCETSVGAQRQKSINLPTLGASETLTDWVVDGNLYLNPTPPAPGLDWAGDSLPFVISPGVSSVLLCGYVRFIIDDVAWFQLPVRVRRWPCRLSPGRVRPGAGLRLTCVGLTGRVQVRFTRRGAPPRTIGAKVGATGSARIPTPPLRRATYQATVLAGGAQLSARTRVRVR